MQDDFIEDICSIHLNRMYDMFRGTVRRDLRGVENRLKQFIVINCKTALLYYLSVKGHHHKISKKTVSAS
jgi:hypothetical protein